MAGDDEERPAAHASVDVPFDALDEATLVALVESFVGREGTDYGAVERTLEEKVADVRRQLERGDARIVFDPETETVNIVHAPRTTSRGR